MNRLLCLRPSKVRLLGHGRVREPPPRWVGNLLTEGRLFIIHIASVDAKLPLRLAPTAADRSNFGRLITLSQLSGRTRLTTYRQVAQGASPARRPLIHHFERFSALIGSRSTRLFGFLPRLLWDLACRLCDFPKAANSSRWINPIVGFRMPVPRGGAALDV